MKELKEILRQRSLPVSGNKAALITKLQASDSQVSRTYHSNEFITLSSTNQTSSLPPYQSRKELQPSSPHLRAQTRDQKIFVTFVNRQISSVSQPDQPRSNFSQSGLVVCRKKYSASGYY